VPDNIADQIILVSSRQVAPLPSKHKNTDQKISQRTYEDSRPLIVDGRHCAEVPESTASPNGVVVLVRSGGEVYGVDCRVVVGARALVTLDAQRSVSLEVCDLAEWAVDLNPQG
jgi:hypothetical protein